MSISNCDGPLDAFSLYSPEAAAECDIEAALCVICHDLMRSLFTKPPENDTEELFYAHHNTKDRLATAATDCSICHLIYDQVDYLSFTSYRLRSYSTYPGLLRIEGPANHVYLKLCCVRESVYSPHNKVITKDPLRNALCLFPVPESYPVTTGTVATESGWLNSCMDTHMTCESMRKISPLPKRVLDISEISTHKVRLYESSGQVAPYVTVSYCWGSGVTLTTTQATFNKHLEIISFERFPRTLRDTILLANALGFRYIWIDALCIIQDDASDWAEQSKQMTDIYQGCALNIAIAEGRDSNSGAVRRLNECSVYVGSIPSLLSGDNKAGKPDKGNISIRAVISTGPSGSFYGGGCCRLESRGWVFQETLVSVASLYITPSGIEWHCCTNSCHPGESPQDPMTMGSPIRKFRRKTAWARHSQRHNTSTLAESSRGLSQGHIYQRRELYSWASQLSRCRLTKFEDKLPCVAGLVSKLPGAENSYLAGLWKEDLPVGLTWLASRPGTLTRPMGAIPSWTWASIEGSIAYWWFFLPESRHEACIRDIEGCEPEITEAWADEVHPRSFGEVRGGQIEIRGKMWLARLSGSGRKVKIDSIFGKKLALTIDESREWTGSSECFILYITQAAVYAASNKSAGPYIFFLVIEKKELGDCEFRRIGLAMLNLSINAYFSRAQADTVTHTVEATGFRQKVVLM